tara:strand:+ start:795 stop:1142 length:348 start_codon:yes stop_codon:yes gene_type:complete
MESLISDKKIKKTVRRIVNIEAAVERLLKNKEALHREKRIADFRKLLERLGEELDFLGGSKAKVAQYRRKETAVQSKEREAQIRLNRQRVKSRRGEDMPMPEVIHLAAPRNKMRK